MEQMITFLVNKKSMELCCYYPRQMISTIIWSYHLSVKDVLVMTIHVRYRVTIAVLAVPIKIPSYTNFCKGKGSGHIKGTLLLKEQRWSHN